MAPPTSYTDTGLKTYMETVLGDVASVLGMTSAGGSFDEALNDTLLSLELTNADEATDIVALRARARIFAWDAALANASARTDFNVDGSSFSNSQLVASIRKRLQDAQSDDGDFGGGTVGSGTFLRSDKWSEDS